MNKSIVLIFLTISTATFAQNQTIHGLVFDKKTNQNLVGATVILQNSKPIIGTVTDANGEFTLTKVPLGRQAIQISFVGYQSFETEALLITSTKQNYISVGLIESVNTSNEVIISAAKNAFEPVNEASVLSARSFSVEESERMPASMVDPGRVALSYPGVQKGTDDTENQIVVRGNSPFGVLWRLEGIDIPNPNHFAVVGSSGGGITAFSGQVLGRSDFSSGVMAAEYGNALSGAFDMHFRQGNLFKREYRNKIGIIGLDFSTEGPIKKGSSSYLVNYRYSTLGLLNKLGFNLVGERVTNDFQDLSYNFTFKNKNQKSIITVFGFGGLSLEQYYPVDDPSKRDATVFNNREYQYKPSNVGATGVTWAYKPNSKSYLKTVIAIMGSNQFRNKDTLNNENVHYRYNTEEYTDVRIASSSTYTHKINNQLNLKTGIILNQIFFDFYKKSYPLKSISDINNDNLKVNVDGKGSTQTFQQYAQLQIDGPKINANLGYHAIVLSANNTAAVDPRLSIQYKLTDKQRISIALGQYSKTLPIMAYFYKNELGEFPNKNLKMIRANQAVIGYQLYTDNKIRFTYEMYYQKLFNVPVVPSILNNYWMLNSSSGFPTTPVISAGRGLNYGADISFEKQFSKSYFLLITASKFKSKFSPFDKVWYNSRFGTDFSSCYTAGKEFNLKKGRIIQIGARYMLTGGFRYTPANEILSKKLGYYVADNSQEYLKRTPNYTRLDTRLAYRFNGRKLAGNLSLDIQNVLNHINASGIRYDNATNKTYTTYQSSGLVPLLTFQFDF